MPIIPFDEPAANAWREGFAFSSRSAFYDETSVAFLHALSRALLKDAEARQYPDLATFAYFCRRANLNALASRYADAAQRSGWGTIVHVAPSNIPINFAFSLAFGLLAGNANIVRVPSRSFPQNDVFVRIYDQLLEMDDFRPIAAANALIRSQRDSESFDALIAEADGLVVWGGDATVARFRALPKKPRCVEIYFPDRRSSAVIDAEACVALSPQERQKLVHDFFNDTYLVDQNACSSPSMIFWIGTPDTVAVAKNGFWAALESELRQRDYHLDPTARIDKHLDLMQIAHRLGRRPHLLARSPDIWCLDELHLPRDLDVRFGQFVEIGLPSIDAIVPHLRSQEQTLTYFGVDPHYVLRAVNVHKGCGVDRIVPIGQALNINPLWDGKDILALLSRRIDVVFPARDRAGAGGSMQAAIQA
jgi:hypothetical protein